MDPQTVEKLTPLLPNVLAFQQFLSEESKKHIQLRRQQTIEEWNSNPENQGQGEDELEEEIEDNIEDLINFYETLVTRCIKKANRNVQAERLAIAIGQVLIQSTYLDQTKNSLEQMAELADQIKKEDQEEDEKFRTILKSKLIES